MSAVIARIGIMGGSGLYQMKGLNDVQEVSVDTPFGKPSDVITVGELSGVPIAFLPRHGRGHRIMPSQIPVKANIYAMKKLGVERLISVSAVGSLRQEIRPLDLVVPDQLIDRTRLRDNTFFGDGVVAHISLGAPFCQELSGILADTASDTDAPVHRGGTCVVMEGPAFSTKAESNLYRSWGASIIGMTALPEAKLAREAEICYAMLACATDYDVWHESEEDVSVEMVIANLHKNVSTSQRVLRDLVPRLVGERRCNCASALAYAIITAPDHIAPEARERLQAIIGKYVS
jgi:5'-methylthioadenosine phosphorylase